MRIGTRGSPLALAQARSVADRLGPGCEIITVTTSGDRGSGEEDKSRWVGELEQALIRGEIDVAVHSAKDVPAALHDELELVAFPAREDARDALCGARSLAALEPGARVGTSSVRRAAQLRALREDLEVVSLRGNVDTRLRKLHEGEVDAIVIALAGLARLGRRIEAGAVLDELVPAAGQGALAIQARKGEILARGLDAVSDAATTACVEAERELVRLLDASCHTPMGAHAGILDELQVELVAWVGLPDGSQWIRDAVTGAPTQVARDVGERMLAAGAGELLRRAALSAGPGP
ncbi:MAG: hydroxymethylbilane synthase [Actinomycetota bacterium]|nr:hydroxymethylbilane synthase [Actinomycetota bacterium]